MWKLQVTADTRQINTPWNLHHFTCSSTKVFRDVKGVISFTLASPRYKLELTHLRQFNATITKFLLFFNLALNGSECSSETMRLRQCEVAQLKTSAPVSGIHCHLSATAKAELSVLSKVCFLNTEEVNASVFVVDMIIIWVEDTIRQRVQHCFLDHLQHYSFHLQMHRELMP